MAKRMKRPFLRPALALALMTGQTQTARSQGSKSSITPRTAYVAGTHEDHNAKHGGIFFMAMDNKHHLEGVLLPPGIFRVYLYNAQTRPLNAAELKQASGTVCVGDSGKAPEILLRLSKDGRTLEAGLGKDLKLPVSLTLLLRLPGMPQNAKPELFTFPFSAFTGAEIQNPAMPGHDHAGGGM